MRTTRTLALAAGVVLALLLAGCSNGTNDAIGTPSPTSSHGPAATGPHNAADVAFAMGMIPHHAQAVEMAELALAGTTSAEVKRLATAIRGAQAPEIATMSGWLSGWGEEVPPFSGSMGHGSGHSGPGMMTQQQMDQLAAASGEDFDRMWVEMMIEHHEGAVTSARTVLSAGQNASVKQLAQAIITAQTTEIATMRDMVKTLAS